MVTKELQVNVSMAEKVVKCDREKGIVKILCFQSHGRVVV